MQENAINLLTSINFFTGYNKRIKLYIMYNFRFTTQHYPVLAVHHTQMRQLDLPLF